MMLAYLIDSQPDIDNKNQTNESECPIVTDDPELNEELEYLWSYEQSGLREKGYTQKEYEKFLARHWHDCQRTK
ncbi:MAG: hypothetical protein AB1706_10160 [Pseudomonadota bacterium]